jgi:hypothetical protein
VIRALVIGAGLMACVACTDTVTGRAWYESGDATYDALKSASDACKSKGGTFQLKAGGDSIRLGDYECVMGKGGK